MTFDPSSPPQPERPKGLGWALALAIVVTLLPVIALPLVIVPAGALAVSAVDAFRDEANPAEVAEGAEELDDALEAIGSDLPADLPWDVELPAGTSVMLISAFDADEGWTDTTKDGPSYLGSDNAATGCTVFWDYYATLDPAVDLTSGDDAATISLIEWMAGGPVDDTISVEPASIVNTAPGGGTTEALQVGLVGDGTVSALIARAFAGIGQGVWIYAECPDEASLSTTLDELPERVATVLLPAS
ncbi:hypothetical protein ACDF64_07870 [Agromyces sp. MMS24-JH15]|uniref:hypothetical protein n=1 Tax=Agromyces sp. MMS24-JH15 TaxID=3243765 RepID=UPI00374822FE